MHGNTGTIHTDLFLHEAPPLLLLAVHLEVVEEGGSLCGVGQRRAVRAHVEEVVTLVHQGLHHRDQELVVVALI